MKPTQERFVVNKAEKSWRSEEHFDIRHGDVEFGVYPAEFWSCFGSVFSHYVSLHPFWNSNEYPVPLYVEIDNLLFCFDCIGVKVKRLHDAQK